MILLGTPKILLLLLLLSEHCLGSGGEMEGGGLQHPPPHPAESNGHQPINGGLPQS